MDKTKKLVLLVISVFIGITVLGVSIAYFIASAQSDEYTVTSGDYTITYEEGSTINASTLYPGEESSAIQYPFTVTNSSIASSNYTIKLNKTSSYAFANMKWKLYNATKSSSGTYTQGTLASSGDFNFSGTNSILSNTMTKGQSKSYILKVWLQDTYANQNADQGQTLTAQIIVEGTSNE